jgi:formate-dependent nitrite reductase cytochrome c552 subunit
MTLTVMLLHIGGGSLRGIHGVHAGRGPIVEYAPSGEDRQTIPWIRYKGTVYLAPDTKPEAVRNLPRRVMDCMDCHNRPTHTFRLPEPALNQEMAAGKISRSLPFMKKMSMQVLQKSYPNRDEAESTIASTLENYYRQSYPEIYKKQHEEVVGSAKGVAGIYDRNIFPHMKVDWGTYPNNLGHMSFPGCFRCHDGTHASADGKVIPNDCGTCHNLLASDEPSPKILSELGLTPAEAVLQ